jgi:hypothetical protein
VSPIRVVMTVLNAVPEMQVAVERIGSEVHVDESVDVLISRLATQMASKETFDFSHAGRPRAPRGATEGAIE